MITKKLTDAEITRLETWADMQADNQRLTKEDKMILDQISSYRKNEWKGIRLTASDKVATSTEQARKKLEELKRRKV